MAYQDPITLAQQQYANRRYAQDVRTQEKSTLPPPTGSMEFLPGTATPTAPARRTTIGTNQVGTAPQTTAIKMATLFDPVSNRRVAVQVDSPQAQALFSQGFKLETPQAAPATAAPTKPTAEAVTETAVEKTETAPVTEPEETTDDILKRYGVSPTNAQSPFTAFAESYRQVFDSLGLTSVKSQIDDLTRDYAALNEKKNDESFQVNENPWLTEGQRRDRLSALDRKYEGKTQSLTSKLTLLNNLFEAGRQEAQFIVQQGLTQQRAGQQFQQDLALKAIEMAERQAQEEAKISREADAAEKRTLTVAEAQALGVPFGTTVAEARTKGLTPAGEVDTEVVTVGGRKVLINSNTGETIRVLGASGEGGEGSVGGAIFGGGGVETTPATQTFEEYLAQKEQEAGMSFSQTRRDQLRKEFDSQQKAAPTADVAGKKNKWLESPSVDARLKDIIRGTSKFTDYSVTERRQLQQQYNQAQNEGVIPKATTAAQEAKFSKLTAKFDQNPVVRQADKAAGLSSVADQVIANPNATNQLVALYSIVKQLDPESAVREGELTLAQSTLSTINRIGLQITRLGKGRVLPPKQAIEFANAVKQLGKAWDSSYKRVNTRFASEARVSGIEDLWNDYTGGFEASQSGPFKSSSGKSYNLPN